MTRIGLSILLLALATGCAQVEAPRGGPEEFPAPRVLDVRPDSLAVLPGFRDDVVVEFQHRISEQNLAEAVRVTPRTSGVLVSRHLNRLRIRLQEGWVPDVIYKVTVGPPLQDRWGGRFEDTLRIVFSTGPEIPETRVEGRVTDRVTGEGVEESRVEAIRMADSLVYETYTRADGSFRLDRIPEGDFLIRGYEDLNANQTLDPFEPRDTARRVVREEAPVELSFRLLAPDDTPPVAEEVAWDGERTVITFDDYLDPLQDIDPEQVTVRDAAGAGVPVTRVVVATADRPEVVADEEEPETPPEPAPIEVDPEAVEVEPLPSRDLHVYLADPLVQGAEYRVVVRGVRNLHGLEGEDVLVLEVPVAEPDEPEDPDPPVTEPPDSPSP